MDNIYKSAKYCRRFVYGTPGDLDDFNSPRSIVLLDDENAYILGSRETYKESVYMAALLIMSSQPAHATMGDTAERYVIKFREEHNARSG